jgi:hypothetical protein
MNKNTAKERLQEKLNKNKKNLFHHTKNIRRGLYSTLIGIPANILQ